MQARDGQRIATHHHGADDNGRPTYLRALCSARRASRPRTALRWALADRRGAVRIVRGGGKTRAQHSPPIREAHRRTGDDRAHHQQRHAHLCELRPPLRSTTALVLTAHAPTGVVATLCLPPARRHARQWLHAAAPGQQQQRDRHDLARRRARATARKDGSALRMTLPTRGNRW